jgi:hypothetical protein
MIAAIYARKSTEWGVTNEERSVTRQISTPRLTRHGREGPSPRTTFTSTTASRCRVREAAGLVRLMNVLRPGPPSGARDERRIALRARADETAAFFKQITDAGVRVFFYLEDRERT